jgi:transposase
MPRGTKYPKELMDRGVRLVFDLGRPVAAVARDLGVHSEALRKRVRQAEAVSGKRTDLPSSEEREEIKKLRNENFELRRANEILKRRRSCVSPPGSPSTIDLADPAECWSTTSPNGVESII